MNILKIPVSTKERMVVLTRRARRRVPDLAFDVTSSLRGKDVLLVSAGLAFYALVSVAPFVVLALWLASLMVGDDQVRHVGAQLARHAPKNLGVDTAFQRVAELGTEIGWKAVLAAAWPATAYGAGLVRALDRLSAGRHKELKGLRGRGMALGLVAMVPVLVLAGLVLSYAVAALIGEGGPARVVGWALSLVAGFVTTAAVAALIYRVFPDRDLPWDGVARGAACAAAAISALSLAFVIYLRLVADFEQRYVTSGLAAVVFLALWLFLANASLLVGYQVAVEWSRSRR